jgi:hypothetical protein
MDFRDICPVFNLTHGFHNQGARALKQLGFVMEELMHIGVSSCMHHSFLPDKVMPVCCLRFWTPSLVFKMYFIKHRVFLEPMGDQFMRKPETKTATAKD